MSKLKDFMVSLPPRTEDESKHHMKTVVLKYILDKSKNSRKSKQLVNSDKQKPRLYKTNFLAELLWGDNYARVFIQHKICMGSSTFRLDLQKLEADQEALFADLSIPVNAKCIAETWKDLRRFVNHTDSYESRLGFGTEPCIQSGGSFNSAKADHGHDAASAHLANSRYSLQLKLNAMKKKRTIIPFPGITDGIPRHDWWDGIVDTKGICMAPYSRSKLCHVASLETGSSIDVVDEEQSTAEALQRQHDLHHAATTSFTDEVHRAFELQYHANWPHTRAWEQDLRRREVKAFLKVAFKSAVSETSAIAAAAKVEPPTTRIPRPTSSTRAATTPAYSNGESSSVAPVISRSRPLAPPRISAGSAAHTDEPVTRGRQPKRQRDRTSPPRNRDENPVAGYQGPDAAAALADYRRKKNLKFGDAFPPKYKVWEEESMRCVRREISP